MDVEALSAFQGGDVSEALRENALPAGFGLYGRRCGISSVEGKKDIALFYSFRPARAAGVFTTNLVKAAPVRLCQKRLKGKGPFRGVLINSGCANACTGARGMKDAEDSLKLLGKGLDLDADQLLVASTGVIGRFLPREALEAGVKGLAEDVAANLVSVDNAVRSVMTTDTRPKAARARFEFGGNTFTVWGCAKGAGMIHPNMATMLSVVLTDAGLPQKELHDSLRWAVDRSFNRVTVDGDTSTNNSLFLLANGAVKEFSKPPKKLLDLFRSALHAVCLSLSVQIAADGEGATRTAWIFVKGAKTEAAASKLASTVATSPLFKTALNGADPNWGRVLAALGRAGVPFDPDKTELRFGDVVVYDRGMKTDYDEKALHGLLTKEKVVVRADLRAGEAWSFAVTCDFSKEYVAINADYTT
jgi:glutamate N-acetyltransferase/amino-acid N-acetyltransferase